MKSIKIWKLDPIIMKTYYSFEYYYWNHAYAENTMKLKVYQSVNWKNVKNKCYSSPGQWANFYQTSNNIIKKSCALIIERFENPEWANKFNYSYNELSLNSTRVRYMQAIFTNFKENSMDTCEFWWISKNNKSFVYTKLFMKPQ